MTVRGLCWGFEVGPRGCPRLHRLTFGRDLLVQQNGTVVHENGTAHVVVQPVPVTSQERGVHEGLSEVARSAASSV